MTKVVLLGGIPTDGALGAGELQGWSDEGKSGYTLATGCLKAFVMRDPECAATVDVVLMDFRVAMFQGCLGPSEIDSILAEEPDVVGLSCRCWDLDVFLTTAQRLKRRAPELIVVLGGPSVSYAPGDILAAHPAVDLIVQGDGELAFLALCKQGFRGRFEAIPGLWYRDATGQPRSSKAPREAVDLAGLPSPYLDGVLSPQASRLTIEHGRGCRFRCAFCACPSLMGGFGRSGRSVS